jgi:hypothetical protein
VCDFPAVMRQAVFVSALIGDNMYHLYTEREQTCDRCSGGPTIRRILAWSFGLLWALSAEAWSMDFVVVGEAGNAPDPLYGHGAVDYVFEIGKHKITNADYVEFLNAVARKGDPFALYSESMATGAFGGIVRTKSDSDYVYASKDHWAKRPVVYVSWYDLARMANWLHFGKSNDGTSHLGTTEGTAIEGAYDTRFFPEGTSDELNMVQGRLLRSYAAGQEEILGLCCAVLPAPEQLAASGR